MAPTFEVMWEGSRVGYSGIVMLGLQLVGPPLLGGVTERGGETMVVERRIWRTHLERSGGECGMRHGGIAFEEVAVELWKRYESLG